VVVARVVAVVHTTLPHHQEMLEQMLEAVETLVVLLQQL
jgi:hypothetical protein